MPYNYLIEGVEPEEYSILKKKKTEIVRSIMGSFNDTWKGRVKNVSASFNYNKKMLAIGITLDKGERNVLVFEREGLSEEENAVVASLYIGLEEELKNIRIRKGPWT